MSEQIKPFFYVLWAIHPIVEVGIAALMLGGVVALLWVAVFVGMVMEAADYMRRF